MSNKQDIINDIKKFDAISAVKETVGGKLLLNSLQKDVISCIDELSSKYKTATHIEMIALVAKLSERLTMLRVLNRSSKLKKLAKEELDFLTKENIE